MSAICGFVSFGSRLNAAAMCGRMLADQAHYGPHANDMSGLDGAALGRALYRTLPEDRFDAQPYRRCGGTILLVADVRIDNRSDIAHLLGVAGASLESCSDAELLGAAYEKWGESVFERVVGDFAFAAWDSRKRMLVLARDPMGQRPLHFHRADDHVAFSSMPSGLHALGTFARAADLSKLAEFVANRPIRHERSAFDNITVVAPGHVVSISAMDLRIRRYWDPPLREVRFANPDDYRDAFREQVSQAVEARLRGADGIVGAHLTSGFDSSTVATTAAQLLRQCGGKVVAFTAAPRHGFDGPAPRGRIVDESVIAARTAAMHPNIEHSIVRSNGRSPFALAPVFHAYAQQPAARLCNHLYWTQINQAAQARNLKILLTGEQGNLTISAGGIAQLADLIRLGRWTRWLREAPAARRTGATWKGILASSFGPWMPLPTWTRLSRRFMGISAQPDPSFLLTSELRNDPRIGRVLDTRPPRDSYAARLWLLKQADFGNRRKASLALWGVDERDPTADRRLIEFCLSLPIDQLWKDGERRPLARAALSDRLPLEVLDARLRGVQMADWHEHVAFEEINELIARYEGSAAAGALLDFDRMRDLAASWPRSGWHRLDVIMDYRGSLIQALVGAQFAEFAARAAPSTDESRRAMAALMQRPTYQLGVS